MKLKSTLQVLLVAFAMTAFVRGSSAAEPPTLRVLCYNIHYGQGTDGKYDVDRLAQVILKAKPDLVALQEVDVGVKRSGRIHEARKLAEPTGNNRRHYGRNDRRRANARRPDGRSASQRIGTATGFGRCDSLLGSGGARIEACGVVSGKRPDDRC